MLAVNGGQTVVQVVKKKPITAGLPRISAVVTVRPLRSTREISPTCPRVSGESAATSKRPCPPPSTPGLQAEKSGSARRQARASVVLFMVLVSVAHGPGGAQPGSKSNSTR